MNTFICEKCNNEMYNLRYFERLSMFCNYCNETQFFNLKKISFEDKIQELKERSRDLKLQAQELNERQTEVDREIIKLEKEEKEKQIFTWENCFTGKGVYISNDSVFQSTHPFCERINNDRSRNIAYSERVAKSMLAMAQLSHIIAKANGDWVADWKDESQKKSTIVRVNNEIRAGNSYYSYSSRK